MKIELKIPENLNEITVEQYQRFLAIEEPTDFDLISIFMKKDKDFIRKIPNKTVTEITEVFTNMLGESGTFIKRFKIGTQEFGFVPDLDNISFGENTDLVQYIQNWDTMHQAMAVMFRPITFKQGNKYLIEEYESSAKYSEIMKRAPLSVAMGSLLFFWHLTNELLSSTLNFLEKEAERLQTSGQVSTQSGELIVNSLQSLKETYSDLMKSPSLTFTKP